MNGVVKNILLPKLLAVFLTFVTPSYGQSVKVSCGVGAGGKVSAASIKINCGLTEADIKLIISEYGALVAREFVKDASQANVKLGIAQEKLSSLSEKFQVQKRAVLTYFRILRQNEVPDEKLFNKFSELAAQHRHLLDQGAVLIRSKSPKVKKLLAEADKATEGGEFDAAQSAITTAFNAQRGWNKKLREKADEGDLSAAEIIARNGDLSLGRLAYLEAADYFEQAVDTVPRGYVKERLTYLESQAGALETHGAEKGDNRSLAHAIKLYREVLAGRDRTNSPDGWARAQHNLGIALGLLGKRESSTDKLNQAVTAYREALKERTRERVPLDWASTQNSLGIALANLGERLNNSDKLNQAITAYREALKEWTRARDPLGWALAQNNLGGAFSLLGQNESSANELNQAVAAYREALKELTRERDPLGWARTQNNLGIAFTILGQLESSTDKLNQAVTAYREALKERTRERVPLDWASTQNNLGNALMRLGERESNTDKLKQAVTAYREALKERTRERVPLDWAFSQADMGNALMRLGKYEQDLTILRAAQRAIKSSHRVYQAGGYNQYDAYFKDQIAQVAKLISELKE